VSVAAAVVVPADAEEVWRVWSEVERWPAWNPVCRSAALDGELAPGTEMELQMVHPRGREFWTRPRLEVVSPGKELTWVAKGMGVRARTQTTLLPDPRGTKVRMHADVTGPMAFAYRMAMTSKVQSQLLLETLDGFAETMRR
jgi:uncharacterized protein YndB with AHSA1/START domain